MSPAVFALNSAATGETPQPELANDGIRLVFDSHHGSLAKITDMPRDHELLSKKTGVSLWSLEMADGTVISPDTANEFTWRIENDSPHALVLRWSALECADAPQLAVVATVMLDAQEAVSRWRIKVEGLGDQVIRNVAFPRISSLQERQGETMAVPQWIGEKTKSVRRLLNPIMGKERRLAWDYPGIMSMQFIAFYADQGSGLMLSTNDTQLLRKQFAVFGDSASGVGLEVVHFPALEEGTTNQYEPNYDTLLQRDRWRLVHGRRTLSTLGQRAVVGKRQSRSES